MQELKLKGVSLSLKDMLGEEYISSVCAAASAIGIGKASDLEAKASKKVDFFPEQFAAHLDGLVEKLGEKVCQPFAHSCPGAGTAAFTAALHATSAPIASLGFLRIGEDGRLYFIGKSEHYQASLGHGFPGYELLHLASEIGISNITHNNTRGHITRTLERELVRIANGIAFGDEAAVEAAVASKEPHVLNRVINLETGSLACEAAFKMMLARFYKLQPHFDAPAHSGCTPVFLVMGDYRNGREANYHGTTIFTQMLRGMWSEMYAGMEAAGLIKAVGVPINDFEGFKAAVEKYDNGKTRIAGFIHELILMNYGAIKLHKDYLQKCYELCHSRNIPCFVDEIQSCMWSPELFLFKEYGLKPDFVSVGKGFPGGMYPASRILTTAEMDNLNLFGALVTNGQEEIASLANLITIRFAEANADYTREIGNQWLASLAEIAARHSKFVRGVEGQGLLSSLVFKETEKAVAFCKKMSQDYCIDVSAQTYKADCPPAALMKPPLISSVKALDIVKSAIDKALSELEG